MSWGELTCKHFGHCDHEPTVHELDDGRLVTATYLPDVGGYAVRPLTTTTGTTPEPPESEAVADE